MLTTNKIIAHKKVGKNLVWLTQVESSYYLVFAQIVQGRKVSTFKIVAQKELSHEEMLVVYQQLTYKTLSLSSGASYDASEILLLETSKVKECVSECKKTYVSVTSPYYPTKEIFLSSQMTGAPNVF